MRNNSFLCYYGLGMVLIIDSRILRFPPPLGRQLASCTRSVCHLVPGLERKPTKPSPRKPPMQGIRKVLTARARWRMAIQSAICDEWAIPIIRDFMRDKKNLNSPLARLKSGPQES